MENKKKSLIGTIVIGIVVAVLVFMVFNNLPGSAEAITEAEFRENFVKNVYTEVVLDIYNVTCVDTQKNTYTFTTADRDSLNEFVLNAIKEAKDNGRIIECGTPEELLEQKGKYYRLVEIQTMSDQLAKTRREERFEVEGKPGRHRGEKNEQGTPSEEQFPQGGMSV